MHQHFKPMGLVLTTAFLLNAAAAPLHWGFFGLVALVPLMMLHDLSWKQRFLWGWFAGFATQAMAYYWIFLTIRDFGGLSAWLSLLAGSLFWVYQGLDLALWLCLFPLLGRVGFKAGLPLAAAVVWFLLQAVVFPYTFPWVYGSLFVEQPILVGGAALWGDHGLTFWATLVQASCYWGLREKQRGLWLLGLIGLVAMVSGNVFRAPVAEDSPQWKVAVIQPNLIPWAKRGQMSGQNIFLAHYQLTAKLSRHELDVVIWPETAIPFALNEATYYKNKLRELAQTLDAAVITGAIERTADERLFNAVYLFPPDNGPIQIYRKQRLVLFSERLPAGFGWMQEFVQGIGGFSPGQGNQVLHYKGRKLIPLICFEALFGDYVRGYDGDLMINVTNDAWFGKTKASALHLQQIRSRSVELQIPLVRATNSGISCWVDSKAQVHGQTGIYEEAAEIYTVTLPKTKTNHLAVKTGASLIKWGSIAILLCLIGLCLKTKQSTQSGTPTLTVEG